MAKAASPHGAISATSTAVTTAWGGGALRMASTRAPRPSGAPSASRVTPSAVLTTQPTRPRRVAWRWMKGRKPTPCTRPRTSIRRRTRAAAFERDGAVRVVIGGSRLHLDALQEDVLGIGVTDVVGCGGAQPGALGDGARRGLLEMLGEVVGRHVAERAKPHRHAHYRHGPLVAGDLLDPAHQAFHQRSFMHGLAPCGPRRRARR